MNPALQSILRDPRVWQAQAENHQQRSLKTGIAALDVLLPGGGWPLAALSEVLLPATGTSELRVLLPSLARQTAGDGWAALVSPPLPPCAAGLAGHGVNLSRLLLVESGVDQLWAAEQILRSGQCRLVICWPGKISARQKHRLQLAAENGDSCCIAVLPDSRNEASSAALKLRLYPGADGLRLHILKNRGGRPGRECLLPHV
ncbi:MAG: translesion DNA synthesis-associated protein ImuA [Gammaproteobacteria bacterium]|nr:MAG: translesion DNA synthesis-associated protein ImuA [Gammaproteobacteria bacterium]